MHDFTTSAIIRTLAFHASWHYAPTRTQLFLSLDVGSEPLEPALQADVARQFDAALTRSLDRRIIVQHSGRFSLAGFGDQIEAGRELEFYYPRKLKKAKRVAGYLRRLPWVRAVFLCNTTALGQARDGGDLDFFVISKTGSIWRTRFASTLPFKLLKSRPSESGKRDPICLSFFITERALDLSWLALPKDDPYLRHWFLALLPLYDDGMLPLFWDANRYLHLRHPFARPWISLEASGGSELPSSQIDQLQAPPLCFSEQLFKRIQSGLFPKVISEIANQDTRVVIRDDVLKFHVDDRRQQFKGRYTDICRQYDVTP